jgi:MEDS: MEthanogen/methylotroph, DcmR Sensory domain
MANEQAEAIASDIAGPRHMVELFETTDSMTDRVSAFVLDGLRQGETVLLAMRLPHWNLISSRLTAANVTLSDAVASGCLTVLDAARTLTRMMWHGVPSRGLFDEVVARTVRQLNSPGATLRVYSDMVDVLAADGFFQAADVLENLWSELASRESLTVLCGYSASTFLNPEASNALGSICRSHTDVRLNQLGVSPASPPRALDLPFD